MSDDLHAQIAAALVTDLKRAVPPVHAYPGGPAMNSGMPRTELDLANAVIAVVQAELDRLAAERDHARRSAESRSLEIDRQRDRLRESEETVARWRQRAEQAEAGIARAQDYCALAADSCRVAARETAQDVIRLLDGDSPAESFEPPPGTGVCDRCKQWETAAALFPRCPDCGRTWDRITAPGEPPNPPYDLPEGFRAGGGGEQ